jgi:hypothetical protein
MSVALNKTIAAKTSDIAKMERALKAHNDHINYLIGVLEQEIYDLNIKLQLAEMEEEDDEGWNSRPALLCRHTATYNSGPPHSPVVRPAPAPPPELSPEELSSIPLTATTDSLKLKELEMRFPGATFVLSTEYKQYVLEYFPDMSGRDKILSKKTMLVYSTFKDFTHKKPNLMAEWKGMYIDLSHLF